MSNLPSHYTNVDHCNSNLQPLVCEPYLHPNHHNTMLHKKTMYRCIFIKFTNSTMLHTLPCLLKSDFKSAARVDADRPLTHRFLLAELLLLDLCSSTNEIYTTCITGTITNMTIIDFFECYQNSGNAIRLVNKSCLNHNLLHCLQFIKHHYITKHVILFPKTQNIRKTISSYVA